MVEAGAAALKMDVAEVRRKNFIPKFSGAFQTLVAVSYDSGDYGAAFDKLLQIFDYTEVPRRAGGGPQAGASARRGLLRLHRGVLHRARPRWSVRSAPAPASTSPVWCACIPRER